MPALEAIAYVSNAARGLTEVQIEHVLDAARERNHALGITGVLLFDEGLFFQYFEGPPESVHIVYERIRRSQFHDGLYVMMREPIEKRAFPDWKMGFTHAPESMILQLADATWKSSMEGIDPGSEPSMGVKMLVRFWKYSLEATNG